MKVLTVGIDKVLLDPANARRHPERNLDTIKSSLARFGQQVPIVVDRDWVCRKGNGTLLAARALEWDTIKIVRTDLAGSEATGFSLADNRASDLGEYDKDVLAETLRALRVDKMDMAAIGYLDDEVDALVADLMNDLVIPEANGKKQGKTAAPKVEWLKCPKCRHRWRPAKS